MTSNGLLNSAKLYLIPTPIGNLGDITLRAIEVLKTVDVVLAEDTRHTLKLLNHLDIQVSMDSFHQHNEHHKVKSVVNRINNGDKIAYCSDAGTPGISDPGFLLVRACLEEQIEIECLPGATAFVPALVSSGLPCDRFIFEGFLPPKKGRMRRIENLIEEERTVVFYESPHRLEKTVRQLIEVLGEERQLCVAKELTKMHEQYVRGSGTEFLEKVQNMTIKGEFVVLVGGKK